MSEITHDHCATQEASQDEVEMGAEIISILTAANARKFGLPADADINGESVAGWVRGGRTFIWWVQGRRRYHAVPISQVTRLVLMERGVYHHGLKCKHCDNHGLNLSVSRDYSVLHAECNTCGELVRRTVNATSKVVRLGAHEQRCFCCKTYTMSQFRVCSRCEQNVFRPEGAWCDLHGPAVGGCLVCDYHQGGDAA